MAVKFSYKYVSLCGISNSCVTMRTMGQSDDDGASRQYFSSDDILTLMLQFCIIINIILKLLQKT